MSFVVITNAFTYRENTWHFHGSIPVLDDSLQVRQLVPDFDNLLKLQVILDDDDVALSIVGHVLARIGRVCRIYTSRKPTTCHKTAANLHTTVA